jgi:crotonobetainyl-CoA:carnitine CoA-transferase CaiB-like acyl-CoA transferase
LGNRGKRSIAIDIKSETGRELFGRLLASADVFLTNWLPGALERARLTVDDIRSFNPKIIIARGTGLGVRGPDRDRGGFDAATYLARGGVAYTLTPFGTDTPAVQGPGFGDLQGGATLAGGVCAALFHRERTGEATVVDSSLLAQAMWAIAPSISAADFFDIDGIPGAPPGLAINPLVNRYTTRDGRWIQLVFLQPDKFWAGFCERMGLAELITDERFVPSSNLIANAAEATEILADVFAGHDLAHWQKPLEDEPGVGRTGDAAGNPQRSTGRTERSYVVTNVDDHGEKYWIVAAPMQSDETPPAPARAPEHGQHTEEILLELAVDWDDIARAKDLKAIL